MAPPPVAPPPRRSCARCVQADALQRTRSPAPAGLKLAGKLLRHSPLSPGQPTGSSCTAACHRRTLGGVVAFFADAKGCRETAFCGSAASQCAGVEHRAPAVVRPVFAFMAILAVANACRSTCWSASWRPRSVPASPSSSPPCSGTSPPPPPWATNWAPNLPPPTR